MPWKPTSFEEYQSEAAARIAALCTRTPAVLAPAQPDDGPMITLGMTETGQEVAIPLLEYGPRQTLFTGAPGSGKTRAQINFERDWALAGGGVISIDPDGGHPHSKFNEQLAWIEQTEIYKHRTVEVIDLNDLLRLTPLNNLEAIDGVHPSVLADETSIAFQRISGEAWTEKPLLEAVMNDILAVLATLGWCIPDAHLLLDPHDSTGIRRWVIDTIADDYLRNGIMRIDQAATAETTKRDFRAMTQGPLNRLSDIERFPITRYMTGAGSSWDLAKSTDEGHIILIDSSPGAQVGESAAKTITSLLFRKIYSVMPQRQHPERLALISIDEAPAVIKGQDDLINFVARARKYGCCGLFALQYTNQCTPEQYAALKNCCSTRVHFKAIDHEEALQHVRDVVPIDMERPKQSMIRPTAVGVRRTNLANRSQSTHEASGQSKAITESESENHSTTDADGQSTAIGSASFSAEGLAESASTGQVLTPDTGFFADPTMLTQTAGAGTNTNTVEGSSSSIINGSSSMHATTSGTSRGVAQTQASNTTKGSGESNGTSEAFEPIYEQLPTTLYTLEESLHQAAHTLKTLRPGEAIVSFGTTTAKIRVPLLPSHTYSPEEIAQLRRRFIDASPSSMSIADAKAALEARQAAIIRAAQEHCTQPEPDLGSRESFKAAADLRALLDEASEPKPQQLPDPPQRPSKNRPAKKTDKPPRGFEPKLVSHNDDIPPRRPSDKA